MNNESVADDQSPRTSPNSSASQTGGPQIEIASDEDWKNRVKAEDAALDQQYRGQPTEGSDSAKATSAGTGQAAQATSPKAEKASSEEPRAAREMPTATFGDLVGLLSAQAMTFLGLIPNPTTQKPETQLPTARYFIDMIAILEEKTAGQLSKEESQILGNTLHELRMTYMQRSRQTA